MKRLENALYLFEVCARRTVETMLGVPTRAIKWFAVSTTFCNPYSVSCVIRSGNKDVSVSITLGIENTDLENLLPNMEMEMRRDAIGEIMNVIAGNCLGNPLFSSPFGIVDRTLPVFLPGKTLISETPCAQGILQVRSVPLFLGIRVEPIVERIPSLPG